MPKSMTGYGRATTNTDNWSLTWEIRSLNNRHLDLKWKIPPTLYGLQKTWEAVVRAVAARGGVELFLGLKILNPELQSISLDTTLASAMLRQLSALAAENNHPFTPDLNRLLAVQGLWRDMGNIDNPALLADLTATLERAVADWDVSRQHEGQALQADLCARFATLGQMVAEIKTLAQGTAAERLAQMQERINKLLAETSITVDPDRMLQELAVLADKVDVSEELTRLEIHLRSIDNYFQTSEPIGRKLDFMVQECFREINTCGNKSQNTQVSQVVVNFKAELEKCREQIQNLE
ncbi:MAG: YicC family protein [Desulfovibrionales bacterium]|nr:YicC family protein [Desulfovibrionales bacterium]